MKSTKIGPLRKLTLTYWDLYKIGMRGGVWKEIPSGKIEKKELEHKPIIAYIEDVSEKDIKIESIECNHSFMIFEYFYKIKGEHTDFVCSICKKNIDKFGKEITSNEEKNNVK